MIRVMFDSITPAAIPPSAQIVGGYIDGRFRWDPAHWARFPHAAHVRICVTGDPNMGNCLDVETGDATPGHAPAWIKARHDAGEKYITVYANRSTMPAVDMACKDLGLTYYRWVATLDGTLNPAGYTPWTTPAAVQFAPARLAGGNVDVSVVYETGWHRQPATVPPAAANDLRHASDFIHSAMGLLGVTG